MKTLKETAALIFLATATSLALAAPPAGGASGPDGYATKATAIGSDRADALAQRNERMGRCKAMTGDEKKGCESQSKADAKAASKSEARGSSGARATK